MFEFSASIFMRLPAVANRNVYLAAKCFVKVFISVLSVKIMNQIRTIRLLQNSDKLKAFTQQHSRPRRKREPTFMAERSSSFFL